MSGFVIRAMLPGDIPSVVELQQAAFPPPFDPELLWEPDHLQRHLQLFPEGQWVADVADRVVGSCSNVRLAEATWAAHASWEATVGGPFLANHDPIGSTLYGLDISVHPEHRRIGIGRAFYSARFDFVRDHGLRRYGTACRMPDYRTKGNGRSVDDFARAVVNGEETDRTLTPLLRYDLEFLEVLENYMDDWESGNAAALLEWRP